MLCHFCWQVTKWNRPCIKLWFGNCGLIVGNIWDNVSAHLNKIYTHFNAEMLHIVCLTWSWNNRNHRNLTRELLCYTVWWLSVSEHTKCVIVVTHCVASAQKWYCILTKECVGGGYRQPYTLLLGYRWNYGSSIYCNVGKNHSCDKCSAQPVLTFSVIRYSMHQKKSNLWNSVG